MASLGVRSGNRGWRRGNREFSSANRRRKALKEPVTEIRIHCRSVRVFRIIARDVRILRGSATKSGDARSRESLQSLRSEARFYGDEAPVAVGDAAFVRDKEVAMRTGHSTMRRRVRRRTCRNNSERERRKDARRLPSTPERGGRQSLSRGALANEARRRCGGQRQDAGRGASRADEAVSETKDLRRPNQGAATSLRRRAGRAASERSSARLPRFSPARQGSGPALRLACAAVSGRHRLDGEMPHGKFLHRL